MIVHDSFMYILRKVFREAFKQILHLYTKQVSASYRFWIETFRATDGMLQLYVNKITKRLYLLIVTKII
jgi:hypothetical protein